MLLQVSQLKNLDKPDPEMHECFQFWLQSESDKLRRTRQAYTEKSHDDDDQTQFLDFHEMFTWDDHYLDDLVLVRPKSDDPVQYNLTKRLFFCR